MPMASFHHPTCAGEMTVMDKAGSLRLARGIEGKDHSHGLAPIGTSLRGVQ